MAYLTTPKLTAENAAAVLTATQKPQTDYTCPWTTALSAKYESDMPVRYEPARPLRSSSSTPHKSKAEKAVCLSDTDKHLFFRQTNYKQPVLTGRLRKQHITTHNSVCC